MAERFRVIGRPVPRIDGVAKVTGAAAYVGDLHLPGLQHAAVARSAVPHARIVSCSLDAARAVPGVTVVLTASDARRHFTANRFGPVVRDTPVLAEDVVRYEGEPVALVVARTADAARRAAGLVDVEYEDLPVLTDIEAAMAEDAPRLHGHAEGGEFGGAWGRGSDPEHNVAGQYHDLRGDPAAAFARVEHVFEHTYHVPPIQHYALENHVVVVEPDGPGLTVHAANQYPFLMARLLSGLLGVPESAIRVRVPFVGGSFGSKEYVNVLPLAALAALAVRAPVRLECSMEESFRSSSRHGARMTFRTALAADGRIAAREVRLLFDTGAYADQGPRVVRQAGYRSPGPYRIPHLRVDAWAVYTNRVPAGAYRGFGASQPIMACERHTDEIAAALELDPVEFRLRNLLALGDDFVAGDRPLDCDLPAGLRLAVAEMRPGHDRPEPGRRLHGVGFAVGAKNSASGRLPSSAIVRLHADGSATVLASSVEIGQGTLTMLAQVAAEALGSGVDRVRVSTPDTGATPFDQRTSSSRSTVHLGLAVQRAAEDASRQACEAAAERCGVPAEGLALREGIVTGGPRPMSIREVIDGPGSRFGGEIIGVGHFVPDEPEAPTAFGMRAGYWEGSVGAAAVAVDPETGEVEVTKLVSVGDAGTVINPLTAHGQEEGGAAMAVGHALFEACVYEGGHLVNPSLLDYRLPTARDVPAALESRLLERGDGPGPYGSKGLGESAIITAAPAIVNAVAAAIGAPLRELPLTPWRVLEALDGREHAEPGAGRA